jgi:hypothetical protein
MNKRDTNPCISCGQERIISKTWTETRTTFSGTLQEIEHIESVCPDANCQNLIEEEFAKQKQKRDKIALDRVQRLEDNKARKGGLRTPSKEASN